MNPSVSAGNPSHDWTLRTANSQQNIIIALTVVLVPVADDLVVLSARGSSREEMSRGFLATTQTMSFPSFLSSTTAGNLPPIQREVRHQFEALESLKTSVLCSPVRRHNEMQRQHAREMQQQRALRASQPRQPKVRRRRRKRKGARTWRRRKTRTQGQRISSPWSSGYGH